MHALFTGALLTSACPCARDIKLENALLDGDARLLKLTDFGYAKTEVDSLPISQVGTPNYAGKSASCTQAGRSSKPSDESDTWKLGDEPSYPC